MDVRKSRKRNVAQSEQTYPIGFLQGSGGKLVSRYSCELARRSLSKICAYWCKAWFWVPVCHVFKVICHRLKLN